MKSKCGTWGYMAPEITRATSSAPIEITPAVDMWSLGIVLYEMSVGYNPAIVFSA